MAASILASNKGTDSTTTTNHTIVMPDDYAANDLLFVIYSCNGEDIDISVSSGWIKTTIYHGNGITFILAYKIAESGSESLTITTGSSVLGSYMIFSIIDYSLILDEAYFIIPHDFTSGSSINAILPTLSPGFGSIEYLWIVFLCTEGTVLATDLPSNFTTLYTQQGISSSSSSLSFGERTYTASYLDPGQFTNASVEWCSIIIAIATEIVGPIGIGLTNIGIVNK